MFERRRYGGPQACGEGKISGLTSVSATLRRPARGALFLREMRVSGAVLRHQTHRALESIERFAMTALFLISEAEMLPNRTVGRPERRAAAEMVDGSIRLPRRVKGPAKLRFNQVILRGH